MDNLEKFIHDNRPDFDSEAPKLDLWADIEGSLDDEEIERFVQSNRADFDTEIPNLKVWAGIEHALGDDDIEQFVQKNRAAFDTEIPNLKIWSAIEKQMYTPIVKKLSVQQWVWRIAAAITLLVVGASSGFYFKTNKEAADMAQTVNKISPDFREAEQFYSQKVNTQLVKLASYQKNSDPSVLADLKQIDEMQKELKKELDEAPNATREDIVKRMIDNYKIKLGILERVLQHLDEQPDNNSTNKENPQHEKI
jgi:ribosomal protein S25